MPYDVLRFIEKLKACATPEEKFSVFAETAAEMGFDQVLYGYSIAQGDAELSDNAEIFSSFRPEFLETYEAENLADHDVSVRHCTVSDRPAPWFDPRVLAQLGEDELKVEHIAMDFGFRAGMTFPAREGSDGLFGGISVATQTLNKSEFERLLEEHQSELHFMALYLHAEMQRSVRPFPANLLTRREQEVLLWAGLGLSSKETAQRLNIAFKTVEAHLESARVKLAANNKVHAVVKAVAHGLITF